MMLYFSVINGRITTSTARKLRLVLSNRRAVRKRRLDEANERTRKACELWLHLEDIYNGYAPWESDEDHDQMKETIEGLYKAAGGEE